MINSIDRIQIATHDAEESARGWVRLLGAELESEDTVRILGAKRFTYRLGRCAIEFLEPDGAGIIGEAMGSRGRPHLFAGGVSTPDFDALVARMRSKGVEVAVENGQAFLNAAKAIGAECPLVVSPSVERDTVGDVDTLYEVTLLADEARDKASRVADFFGLDGENFTDIQSERFGYDGVLTLFGPDALHRFEVITPYSRDTTMRRFLDRSGPAYYMAFVEAPDLILIEERARSENAPVTINRPENRDSSKTADEMWLHPAALGGVMLGVSRPTMAWQWSGRPERVEEVV